MNKTSKTLLVIVGLIFVMSLSFIVMADEYIEPHSPEEGTDIEELATAMGEEVANEAFEEGVVVSEEETTVSEEITVSEEQIFISEEEKTFLEETGVYETEYESAQTETAESSRQQTAELSVSYRVSGKNSGWTEWAENGNAAITDGKISGIEILSSDDGYVEILYSVYDSTNGWSEWLSGAVELNNPISALRMTLSGDGASDYNIYYSVSTIYAGYSEWVCNAEAAGGFTEENGEITGIRVSIVEAGSEFTGIENEETVEVSEADTVIETAAEVSTDGTGEPLTESENETEAEAPAQAETLPEETVSTPETSKEEAANTEPVTEALTETEPITETLTETEPVTEVLTEAEPVTEMSTETELVTEMSTETEPESGKTDGEIIEGTFHVTTVEDDADILLVEEEGATFTNLTHSSSGSISALYAYPNTYKNTGKSKTDLISVAATQVGYYRAENTQTKYGLWYGYPTSAWCAMFVSWCADQAGVNSSTIKPYCRCASEATWFKSLNRWKNAAGYTPKEGDLIFFHYNGSTINHTGIVTGVQDGYVYCIEGNNSNSVNITRHKLTANYISGYGSPDYGQADSGVKYSAHVKSYGWLDYVLEGRQAGTTGEYRRMEAVKISLSDSLAAEGGISYRVHVKSYGWMPWVSNGQVAGTTGEYRRMETIEIQLTGALAEKYDVYYRVHTEHYGWLGWTKNGGMAGTSGMAVRMEAIEIQLVEKGGSAPGSTSTPYMKK